MISFWGRLITGHQNKLSFIIYQIMTNENKQSGATFKWLESIKNILNENGFHYIWLQQRNIEQLNYGIIKQTLADQSVQKLRAEFGNSNRGRHYDVLKNSWCLESYFGKLDPIHAINLFNLEHVTTNFQ